MTQLLILSVSAGNGHVRAAQALAATAQTLVPPCTAVHIDAMAHVAPGFRKVYTEGYIQLVNRAPDLWSYLHQRADTTPHHAASQRLRRGIERLSAGALLREVRRVQPDAVVCTHFLPAELLMRERRRGRIDYPVWLQITDYDLHNMWLVPEMTGYLAATEEVAFRLRARGIPAERIHVTGIPVMPAFSEPDAPALARATCAAALGLDPSHPILLMASGGAGVGDLPSMVERVLATSDQAQVIAVAGRNVEAHGRLQALAARHPGRMVAIGFTDEMHKLMAAADLVVTKPGGLTVSECLALGKPMLLISPIPGQEEHNAGFLMEEGAAWLAYDAIGLDYKVARLMADRPKLARMAGRSRALGKPQAAAAVLQRVLQRAPA
ncbi:MGDG synthase family glycosyltransferase [Variovorax sp. LT1R16]|uniref:MGDG synthase family glycosyltransferase n=1 Tax=Variovorax sp. LT1R16 TaxID=3443728 RepID=UPI003F45E6E5